MTAPSGRCTLREWGVYRKVFEVVASGACGTLCSLRWTWFLRSEGTDYVPVLAGLLDGSRVLAGGKLKRLHIEPVENAPSCFAMAEFENGIVSEFEVSKALPAGVPEARFLVADFTEGRLTNRPLVGFHHAEGAFLATDAGAGAILFEPEPVVAGNPEDADILDAIALALKGGA